MKNLSAAITALVMMATTFAAHATTDREVVEKFYSQLLNGTTHADLPARVADILPPSWQDYGGYNQPSKTRDQFLAELQGIGQVAPDLNWKVEEILQSGDRFIVRGHATATPVGAFLGVTPNGHGFEIMSIDIHTVENHKIVKTYHVEDWFGAVQQLKAK